MIIGLQFYGPLARPEANVTETLKAVKALGIERIEPCITFFDMGGRNRSFWTLQELEEYMPLIRELGFEVPSCHIATKDLLLDAPKMKEVADKYGIGAFVLQTPGDISEKNLQEYAFRIRQAADILGTSASLWLHNGAADIKGQTQGRSAYEYLTDICLGKLRMQVDVGWAYRGGADPMEFMKRNEKRIASVHFKDFMADPEVKGDVPVGEGAVDTESCLYFARALGLPTFIDQDNYAEFPGDAEKSVKTVSRYSGGRKDVISFLNILDTETGEVKVLRRFDGVIEAPNWLKKTNELVYNAGGKIYRYDIDKDSITEVDTDVCTRCNNDHVISEDEKWIAVSNSEPGASVIYRIPLDGGKAEQVTEKGILSYLHGWSPDMKTLVFCGFRKPDGEETRIDVYAVPAEGGEEVRLTKEGFNDGPEYAPDGKKIWYISTRSGLMQVYCMNADGTDERQMTFEDQNNWFGHISPDNRKVVNISYKKGELRPSEHLPNMEVSLWLMDSDGGNRKKLLTFFGGQGTINVNSWAKDSRHLAFVSYDVKK